jgi:hypothetical protein
VKILVGWWNPRTSELVDIPTFDLVHDTTGWLPATVDVPRRQFNDLLKALTEPR